MSVKYCDEGGNVRAVCSNMESVNTGVPQGSVLAPVLFTLYVNDLVDCLESDCLPTLYADDTSLLVSGLDDDNIERKCNTNLNNLLGWFSRNSLYLNAAKTNYIQFHNVQKKQSKLLNISIGGVSVTSAVQCKFLGLTIDENLNWKGHCERLMQQTNSASYLMKNLRGVLVREQLLTVYFAYVESRLRYGICVWGSSVLVADVLVAQKRVLRSMAGLHCRQSCRETFKCWKILTVVSLYILEISIYIFKNKSKFKLVSHVHSINTRNGCNFFVPFARLNLTKKSPNIQGLRIFNSLPARIKCISSLTIFKRQLRLFLSNNCFYNLEEFYSASGGGEAVR